MLGFLAAVLSTHAEAAPRDLAPLWEPEDDQLDAHVVTGLGPPTRSPPADAPNVLIISIDTWRADRLGLYGSPRRTSPWLEAFAADAVVFDRAVAPAPWTWPTMVSLVTGHHTREHAVTKAWTPLCPEAKTLAEVAHEGGWRTGFVGSNLYFEPPESGFQQGFEYYWAHGGVPADGVMVYVDRFLEGARGLPYLLHVHFLDPHCPYDAPAADLKAVQSVKFGLRGLPKDRSTYRLEEDLIRGHLCHAVPPPPANAHELDSQDIPVQTDLQSYLDAYDAELLEVDRHLAILQDRIGPEWDRSWIVITGDHGEEFMEHGRIGHGSAVYRESTWVPLLIRPPGGLGGQGRRISEPVSLVDVAPTLSKALTGGAIHLGSGQDLGPALKGEPLAALPVFSESLYGYREWAALLEWQDHRFVVSGQPARGELFKVDDLMEWTDLLRSEPSPAHSLRAASLAGALGHVLQEQTSRQICTPRSIDLEESHWAALRALGYADAAPESPSAPSP